MSRSRLSFVASLLTAVTAVGFSAAQSTPPNAPPAPQPAAPPQAAPAQAAPADAKKDAAAKPADDGKVDLRAEVAALEQVWKRRTAFTWLKKSKETLEALGKAIDPTSAASIQALVNDKIRADELEYHYVEKAKNCEQRILGQLRNDHFRGVADLLEALAKESYPVSPATANLVEIIDLNWRFAQRRKLLDDGDEMRELGRKLSAEASRILGTSGHSLEEVAKDLWEKTKPEEFPAGWFDVSSGPINFDFGPVPECKEFPRVDLVTATREQLMEVPEIEGDDADAIVKYRTKHGIKGPEELRFIDTIPAEQVEPLATLFFASAAPAPKKKWTVMVYLNAANNLEPCGIKDMNEMEAAGSSNDVNVLVECARFQAHPQPRPNGAYMSNPFSESTANQYYFGLDNTPGTRRYYILKDDDRVRIRSVMLGNVGDTDAGRPEPLANFGRWAVENFPADHYALVIWNHGAGWAGVSADENTHHTLEMPDVRVALEGICDQLKKQDHPGGKIDVLDFDACLMATLEVAYELRGAVDFLASSQETEPGDGMAYDEYLRWLDTYPEAPPASLAKAMVETYVKSYAPGGVQVESNEHWYSGETKSAIRLARVADLRTALDGVAKLLEPKPDLLGDVADRIVKDTRRFGDLVDIEDFLNKVQEHEKKTAGKVDPALKAACEKVVDLIGYPNDGKDKLINEVVIKRRTPGNVLWGFNGWAIPPRNLAPFMQDAKTAKTPLVGPDEKGDYVARITFPPMLRNNKTGKFEFVSEIDYQFEGEGDKKIVKDFANSFFTADFPADAAIVAEGHNVGNNRSHGLSVYFPAYLGFSKDYLRLQFAQESPWTELCEKFPIKKIEKPKGIALLGLSHLTKGERDELGKAVVFEDLEKKALAHDFNKGYAEDLKALGREFDAIRDPKPYGMDWTQMLGLYQPGVIVLDNHTGGELGSGGMSMDDVYALLAQFMPGSDGMGGGKRAKLPRAVGPEGRNVLRFLQAGGRMLLGAPNVTKAVWDTPLYKDALGLQYVRKWDRGFEFNVVGVKEIAADKKIALTTSTKRDSITVFEPIGGADGAKGVEPFVKLPDGQWLGAKISRVDPTTKKPFRAIVLGFYLADVANTDDRRALLAEALRFLEANPDEANLSTASAAAAASPAPAASGSGATQGGG